jgi:LacI family transcriptional regulator
MTLQTAGAWDEVHEGLDRWLSKMVAPTGILACEDKDCRIVADACIHNGLHVPDDIMLVGISNNSLVCEAMEPTLTSIDQGCHAIGYEAAKLLDEIMQGKTPPREEIFPSPPQLIERQSTRAIAVEDRMVAAALRYIRRNHAGTLQVSDVVAELPVSRRSLERRFRETVGTTIHDQIMLARIEKARRLLIETEDPLKRIAEQSGFSSLEHLCKAFKKSEKTTPGEYRKNNTA